LDSIEAVRSTGIVRVWFYVILSPVLIYKAAPQKIQHSPSTTQKSLALPLTVTSHVAHQSLILENTNLFSISMILYQAYYRGRTCSMRQILSLDLMPWSNAEVVSCVNSSFIFIPE
jgi:hypothetical protein